jgi:hypothetical protein
MTLTLGQKIAMGSVTLGVLAGATAQLTPLVGHVVATDIASMASLLNTVLSGWIFIVTGQANIVQQVAAMPGVERVAVNAQANPTLASVAVDPDQPKVGPASPEIRSTLVNTARSA